MPHHDYEGSCSNLRQIGRLPKDPIGREVKITFDARPARAWLPAPLTARRLLLDVATVRVTERAAAAVVRGGVLLAPSFDPRARLLFRVEGVASSGIEGVRAPIRDVALAELDPDATTTTAAWVADNLAVVEDCLAHAATTEALNTGTLHSWHRRLMVHGRLPSELVGRFRDRQVWIGGASPQSAAYVPPPAGDIRWLMADLVRYLNRPVDDAVTRAAVAHAQFETIHPYGDGNGRLGRLIVLWILARDLAVATPPPVSVLIARDSGGYLSGLHSFRNGPIGTWVRWFAGVIERAAAGTMKWTGSVEEIVARWRAQLADLRADATARRLIDLLPAHPVISADQTAAELGVSDTAARSALDLLRDRGIVADLSVPSPGRGRPRRWWIAVELEEVLGSWPA